MYKTSRKILYLKCGNVINQFHDNNNGFYFSLYVKVPGRMGMIVTLYLISANVYNSVNAPNGRGFSYIEIWMLGSQFPILLALFEYGLILLFKKVDKMSDMQIKKLDFAAMIISFSLFLTFSYFYVIVVFI